jgi:hypothetical protein
LTPTGVRATGTVTVAGPPPKGRDFAMQRSGSPSVEDRLLGGLINRPDAVVPLLGVLGPEHFGSEANRAIFKAIVTLQKLGRTVGLAPIYQHLLESGQAHGVVQASDLAELWDVQCSPEEVRAFVHLLVQGIGRSIPTAPQAPAQIDPPPDAMSPPGEIDVSFMFGANVCEGEDKETGA